MVNISDTRWTVEWEIFALDTTTNQVVYVTYVYAFTCDEAIVIAVDRYKVTMRYRNFDAKKKV